MSILSTSPAEIKSCCAAAYESDWARRLLGDSFHPGGVALTERIGTLLALTPADRVIDVAAGTGTSAIALARRFGCRVVGVDLGAESVAAARQAAADAGVADLVTFEVGDAERLPFGDGAFDVALCECAFCTFPDKATASAELARVLRPGGRIGLSDLTRQGALPAELEGLLAWVACIADARPVEEYVSFLEAAGFGTTDVEPHDAALAEMVASIRQKLLGAQVLAAIGKLNVPGVDWNQASGMARAAAEATTRGQLGYVAIVAKLPGTVGHVLPENSLLLPMS